MQPPLPMALLPGCITTVINIEGTVAAGTQPSFCYYRGDSSIAAFATPIVDIKNNIFNNSRSGGTGKHYAIANSYRAATSNAGGWGANASNYNVLNAYAAAVGYWSGDRTFASWKSIASSDANSLSGLNLIFANPASGDLHLTNTIDIVVDGKATPLVAVTNDFDDETPKCFHGRILAPMNLMPVLYPLPLYILQATNREV